MTVDEQTENTEQDDTLHPDEAAVLEGASGNDDTPAPEPEPEPDTEGEPEPPAPTPASEKQIEAVFKRLDKAAERYMSEVGRAIEGHDLGLDKCPLCTYPALVFPYGGDASDDVIKRQLTEVYFGVTRDELPADEGWVECAKCDGHGYLARPTKVEGNKKAICPDCNGMGCREKAQMQAQAAVYTLPNTVTGATTWTLPEQATPDEWGRPPGHPHYGIHPAAAGLSA